jgi:hypothetical protein
MTKKIAYTATFSDGTVKTRNSHREYGFAYHATGTTADGTVVTSRGGFSRTRALAQRAMDAEMSWLVTKPTMPRHVGGIAYTIEMRKRIAAWKPGKIDFAEVVATSRPGPELLSELFPVAGR